MCRYIRSESDEDEVVLEFIRPHVLSSHQYGDLQPHGNHDCHYQNPCQYFYDDWILRDSETLVWERHILPS